LGKPGGNAIFQRFLQNSENPVSIKPSKEKCRCRIKRINADAELRQLLELRAKEAHDRATALAEARERGIEEGIQKGIEKGIEKGAREERLVVARRMLSRGLEAPFVAETTGLPLEEVHRLQAGKV